MESQSKNQNSYVFQVDAVIVSLTNCKEFHQMTLNAIDSLHKSENGIKFNVILVESNPDYEIQGFKYPDDVKVIIPECSFNYNKFMNIGLQQGKSDWVCLCNNDLIFTDGWFRKILRTWVTLNFIPESFGTWNPATHNEFFRERKPIYFGFRTSYEVSGWCIVCRRKLFDKFKLNEGVEFWFSDNHYADDLQKHKIVHVLVRDAVVRHLESKTTDSLPKEKIFELRDAQYEKYLATK